jgi:hypothetical protein
MMMMVVVVVVMVVVVAYVPCRVYSQLERALTVFGNV